jgi:hypothetical protein
MRSQKTPGDPRMQGSRMMLGNRRILGSRRKMGPQRTKESLKIGGSRMTRESRRKRKLLTGDHRRLLPGRIRAERKILAVLPKMSFSPPLNIRQRDPGYYTPEITNSSIAPII